MLASSSGTLVDSDEKSGSNVPISDTSASSSKERVGGGSYPHPALSAASLTKPSVTGMMMKFGNKFFQVVEELKMRRECEVESEEKIKSLVAAQHKLEQTLEEEKTKYSNLVELQAQQEEQTKRTHDEQLRRLEEERRKLTLTLAAKEKEFKVIKDEIRTLYMARYSHEKKLKEQERMLQLYNTSRDSIVSQITQLEQNCSTAFSKVSEITEQMEKLDSNVKQAVIFNKKLKYINSHQQCIIDETKRDLETTKKQLLDARVSRASKEGDTSMTADRSCSPEEITRLRNCSHELKVQEEFIKQLQNQLSRSREEQSSLLQRLQEAHQLVDCHAKTSNKAAASEAAMKKEVDDLKKMKKDIEVESCEAYNVQQRQHEKSILETQEQCANLTRQLKSLQEDHIALQKAHDSLESTHQQLVVEKQTLKSELDVSKEDNVQLDLKLKELQRELSQKNEAVESANDKKLESCDPGENREEHRHDPSPQCPNTSASSEVAPVLSPKPVSSTSELRKDEIIKLSPRVCITKIPIHSGDIVKKPNAGATKRPCPDSSLSKSDEVQLETPLSSPAKKSRLDCDTAESSCGTAPVPVDTVASSTSEISHALTDEKNSEQSSAQVEEKETDGGLVDESKESSVFVVFSDDDSLSGDEDRMMDTQLSNQISKVQSFLKMDRLRRTKPKK